MNILLVKPPQETNEIIPPLGLGYLASTVKEFTNIEILDCIKKDYTIKDYVNYIKNKHYDVIGFQCYSVDFNTVKQLSKLTKQILSDCITLIGGPQPSLDVNTLKYQPYIDYGFKGEAEIGFPILIKEIQNKKLTRKSIKKIPGLIYRIENKIVFNQNRFPENLDSYKPCWDLYGLKDYPLAPHCAFCKQSPTAPIIVSRGCPFECTYCGAHIISGRRIRYHSVKYVINQIKTLYNLYGIREIHIEDDGFTTNKNYVKEFCNKLIELNLPITWTLPNGVRLDTLDEELLKLMKKSGLYAISVGIESGSNRILKLMKKRITTKIIEEKIKLISKIDLEIIAYFIIGYPTETEEEINETIKFAKKLDLKRAGFFIFKPFPGTEVYKELIKNNEISELKWENFSLDKVVWSSKEIGNKKLKNLRRKALLEFYLRPRIMFKMFSEIKNFENFYLIIRRIYRWLK